MAGSVVRQAHHELLGGSPRPIGNGNGAWEGVCPGEPGFSPARPDSNVAIVTLARCANDLLFPILCPMLQPPNTPPWPCVPYRPLSESVGLCRTIVALLSQSDAFAVAMCRGIVAPETPKHE